jgi:hypothetical protein
MQRFLNLLFFTDAVHVSGGSFAHHQEHINCTYSSFISSTVAASSSIGWQYLKLYVQLMCSWWWAEKPPETCTASVKISKFKKRCNLLSVICSFISKFNKPINFFGAALFNNSSHHITSYHIIYYIMNWCSSNFHIIFTTFISLLWVTNMSRLIKIHNPFNSDLC